MKRSALPPGRPSLFNTGVTLFEPGDEAVVRRSKRLKPSLDTFTVPAQAHSSLAKPPSTPGASGRTRLPGRQRKVASAALLNEGASPLTGEDLKQEDSDSEAKPAPRPRAKRASASASSPRKPGKQKPVATALATPHPAPLRWQEAYDAIKRMRARVLKETEPKNQRFSTLVSLMLSSQTKDEVTDAAVSKLREALGGTLSVDALRNADDSTISDAICKVGFWRRKTQYIKQAAQKLHDEFGSDVPQTVDELCSLPGVGPKMAFLALQVAWNINVGIGVDVHVHRITNRLGLNLQSWLPRELHPEINHLLVGFGQTICAPTGPKCDQCELSELDGLCPSARKGIKATATSRRIKPKMELKSEDEEEAKPKIEISFEEEAKARKGLTKCKSRA
ncbi:DNA glycosylase [Epithele typhae]|uniref:DNA glycosylase n=1 Tax=Epithele typhae TaxID=378194 RepID=UPI002008C918|nr:DNA glycosylase [Epithele typhae]KAH9914519.1 DNA glycosylase [Epithele typhae]